jgi:hypothetical protein
MGLISIAAYRPKPGKEAVLLELTRQHVPALRGLGLVTDRKPVAMRAADGTIVEVFEWRSAEAISQAHVNPVVQEMWEKYGAACDYVRLVDLPESQSMFAGFEPIDL